MSPVAPTPAFLRNFYFLRAGVAAVWVTLAFTVGVKSPALGALLLVLYPAWDALANLIDARANGGLRANLTQTTNLAISLIATAAMVAGAVQLGIHFMIGVFGVWAVLAGLFQLLTGLRRWKTAGAQWAMILSGAQSILAGVFFTILSQGTADLSIATVAGYAGFGAFYFLVSAVWLTVRRAK
ncbi:MAG: DUF308 domain-containing protein [Caulobacteraceae bacterium]|nr:DUF308 domain-containing protein [Caulobacteraceae bacterium]